MIEDIFQVLTSHPALISSYNVYKDMIEDIFQVLTSHHELIPFDISQLRLIIISQEISGYNNPNIDFSFGKQHIISRRDDRG